MSELLMVVRLRDTATSAHLLHDVPLLLLICHVFVR